VPADPGAAFGTDPGAAFQQPAHITDCEDHFQPTWPCLS
jgi:hypothetical protein